DRLALASVRIRKLSLAVRVQKSDQARTVGAQMFVSIYKTPSIEMSVDVRIAPVDRQAVDLHRIENFFSVITGVRRVLKGNRELVMTEEGPLPLPHISAGPVGRFNALHVVHGFSGS